MKQSRPRLLNNATIAVLRKSLLFKNTPPDMLTDLFSYGVTRKVQRGETLFVQGDPAHSLYVVLEGWIKLVRILPNGDEVVVAVYSKGQSFGEAVALMGGTYPVTVEAAEDSSVFQIAAKPLQDAIRNNPEMAMAMLAATFHHLHEFVLEIEDIKGHTGAQRLATFLLALTPVDTGACTFSLPYDKTLIAGRLGMKPESLSRSFANLRKHGVTVVRGNVAVTNVDVLRNFISDEPISNAPVQVAQ